MFELSQIGIEAASYLMIGSILVLLLTGLPLAFITGLVALVFALGWFGPMAIPLVTTRIY